MKNNRLQRWLILGACFLIMAVVFSIINSVHSLFIAPVTEAMGFSIASFSLLFTIAGITTALISPIVGRLIGKINIKLIMSFGVITAGLSFAAYGFVSSITAFYIIGFISAVGVTSTSTIPISTLLNYWFKEKKGTAMGIAFAGIGTGTFFWMQVATFLIEKRGYRYAYVILGLIVIAIALPLVLFFIKLPKEAFSSEGEEVKEKSSGIGVKINLNFILFSFALLILGLTVSGTKVHIQPYLGYAGYSLKYSANIGSAQSAFALLGNVLGGYIFDKFPLKVSVTILSLFALGSYVALLFVGINGIAFVFAALYGLFLCLPSVLPAYGVGELFKEGEYAVTFGIVNMVFTFGSAFGPLISGIIADITNYSLVWVIYFITTLIYLVILLVTIKRIKKQSRIN